MKVIVYMICKRRCISADGLYRSVLFNYECLYECIVIAYVCVCVCII